MRPSSSPKRTANRAIEAFTPKALILNHELRHRFIIGDIGIGKAGLIQPFEKPVKLLGGWVAKGCNGDYVVVDNSLRQLYSRSSKISLEGERLCHSANQ